MMQFLVLTSCGPAGPGPRPSAAAQMLKMAVPQKAARPLALPTMQGAFCCAKYARTMYPILHPCRFVFRVRIVVHLPIPAVPMELTPHAQEGDTWWAGAGPPGGGWRNSVADYHGHESLGAAGRKHEAVASFIHEKMNERTSRIKLVPAICPQYLHAADKV